MQLFVNDLTVMDFSYLCAQRGMVGESWIVDVILDGELNEESMVLDFGKVKKELKFLIDEYVDHKLLVPAEHAFSQIKRDPNTDEVKVDFLRPNGKSIHLLCPAEAYAFVYASEVDIDSVGQYLKEVIATHLPSNVDGIELILRPEVIDTPFYHYTHGLKKHDGNCQRIAHGHRSKVVIYENDKLNLAWQAYWAERWQDIYIGSEEDIVDGQQSVLAGQVENTETHFFFTYESSQGEFSLAIPKSECEIVNTDSTVECLAQYMALDLKQQSPQSHFKVFAFEGVGKGAIAYA
ncbi:MULTISPECIES: 6-pyruvoyl trahydropterin synthase family protein [Alteromonadaceae]|uniref:6-pyruvoyl trahydropterin synthase family protein n=1 Tax=Alteromonadaceae TaxID=72275 RepID=UPI001C082F92|nr:MULTISPECIES: 6-carboxytetrahydropterin synthase [Aliiglaciecola]MBU2877345.1 6-carboxytetrahydropterin synthase [Aliiglaciecola lipolytica]MDO6712993.1 6-carboxytetrahydropterin synthase [Aliiglaciecola sp. 2_MG-2023]MDO6754032.1 6-carboxytetrahydropterin synthase [Aliiglaciecola sp. 1_MG-2023]